MELFRCFAEESPHQQGCLDKKKGALIMPTWNDYKSYVRNTSPEIAKDIDEIEAISKIIGAMVAQRHSMNLSQRDLAYLCQLPQSSIARIESGKTTPNLTTLLKIFNQLQLTIEIQPATNAAK